jgi:hypothetical protein
MRFVVMRYDSLRTFDTGVGRKNARGPRGRRAYWHSWWEVPASPPWRTCSPPIPRRRPRMVMPAANPRARCSTALSVTTSPPARTVSRRHLSLTATRCLLRPFRRVGWTAAPCTRIRCSSCRRCHLHRHLHRHRPQVARPWRRATFVPSDDITHGAMVAMWAWRRLRAPSMVVSNTRNSRNGMRWDEVEPAGRVLLEHDIGHEPAGPARRRELHEHAAVERQVIGPRGEPGFGELPAADGSLPSIRVERFKLGWLKGLSDREGHLPQLAPEHRYVVLTHTHVAPLG